MQQPLFDFAASDEYTGFRLERLELYNWGTFDKQVWVLQPDSHNCLLTGDIGSGKSTVVDAVTTLFVPAHRIAFNKAAGADKKERSLRSYVLGYYKTERSDMASTAAPVALRDINSYSVVLGVFYNQGYNQKITLAQVFWCKQRHGQPERFYVVAKQPLSIAEHFADFGDDITALRKRLRSKDAIEVFDRFTPYRSEFKRHFGIKNEQALELFHQTVSMKSVGNLTDFVREHMLESFDVQSDIRSLITHYDDLSQAHEAVLKAKEQIRQLTPLTELHQQYQEIKANSTHLRTCQAGIPSYFSLLKEKLLAQQLQNLTSDQGRLDHEIDLAEEKKIVLQGKIQDMKQAIADNGGDRLDQLQREIDTVLERRVQKQRRAARYAELALSVDLDTEQSAEAFMRNIVSLPGLLETCQQESHNLQETVTRESVTLQQRRDKHQSLHKELESLSARQNNISTNLIRIRTGLCNSLQLREEQIPFVGELLQVREEEEAWEGTAERVLHNFGLSLLVPDELYNQVADYVDNTHLQGRLVYYRVHTDQRPAFLDCHPHSLVAKLAIKPGSRFSAWLEKELVRRFNYICCDSMEQFRREKQAITMSGQIKSGGTRHEKDDRHRLQDRSRYILGWDNQQKVTAIKKDVDACERSIQDISDRIAMTLGLKQEAETALDTLRRLEEFTTFAEQDWQAEEDKAAALADEKERLEASSDILTTLSEELQDIETQVHEAERHERSLLEQRGILAEKQRRTLAEQDLCQQSIGQVKEEEREDLFAYLENARIETMGDEELHLENWEEKAQNVRRWLQARIDDLDNQTRQITHTITTAMHTYCAAFPVETQEVDRTIEAASEYQEILAALQADNLPKYEQRFKELLNQNTIREVVQFQARLDRQRQTIKERIDQINHSLAGIAYNPGRYIRLEHVMNPDPEIREFRRQLKACIDDTFNDTEDEQYAENKFLLVSQLIDRFKGREDLLETDKKWARKVADVRNWFVFAASERYQDDGSEYEHYTDTGGKSGGQKEKLAYTVLAASLVYQFGLEQGEITSRSFRFVVIDEAFGRGSDESTRYALQLFKKLNLQLLIVTPLQKIHIIEPFVATVGFVHNEGGRESQLRNLTIREYHQAKMAMEKREK